jgi:hypothetical protein
MHIIWTSFYFIKEINKDLVKKGVPNKFILSSGISNDKYENDKEVFNSL